MERLKYLVIESKEELKTGDWVYNIHNCVGLERIMEVHISRRGVLRLRSSENPTGKVIPVEKRGIGEMEGKKTYCLHGYHRATPDQIKQSLEEAERCLGWYKQNLVRSSR